MSVKKIILLTKSIFLPLLFMLSINVFAGVEECLEERWRETNPTKLDQEFDTSNDFDRDGNRYSCNAFTTPTKINNFLTQLKLVINNNDINAISEMIKFPLRVRAPGYTVTDEGYRKGNSFKISSQKEFKEMYSRVVFTLELENVFNCVSLNNLVSLPGQSISLAPGIWIYVDPDTHDLSISGLSSDRKRLAKWLDMNNCEESTQR